ncbi:amino acid permease [Mycoplasma sp. Ms02]|uniref:amino acid permease n=1 Tax=Mycoplasma sp. Ms02 TaxID=353851 RepID=UPI001C8A427D|nr:amino acid permease [Mycoplasma sp. Ms02]QZE12483.1 APC family permease [Mycoplasma sp. Ms02]
MDKYNKHNHLKPKNKISFFMGMMIVVGSSIGAGIFFKSGVILKYNNLSLILSALSWLIASIAIIIMALSLIPITSKKKGNLSFVGWNEHFNSWMTYQMSKNFAVYINVALTYFFMPLYAIMSLQDGIKSFLGEGSSPSFGTSNDWAIWMLIGIGIVLYFSLTSGLNSRAATIQNGITLTFKIFAIIASVVVAFVFIFVQKSLLELKWLPEMKNDAHQVPFAYKMIPGLGLFLSWAGIFFAYDGFYVSTGIEEELENPKDTPKVLLFGLTLVTIIHLVIAISMSLNGKGDFNEFGAFLAKRNLSWLMGIINISIFIGVLGIMNGFSMWIPRLLQELILKDELPFSKRLKSKIKAGSYKVGVMVSLIIAIPPVILFYVIGGLFFHEGHDFIGYGTGMASLYNLNELVSNWVSVIIFGFIGLAIFGFARNSQKNKWSNGKLITILSYIVSIFLFVVLFVNFLIPIIDLTYLYTGIKAISNDSQLLQEYKDNIKNIYISLAILLSMVSAITLPAIWTKTKLSRAK